MFRISMFIKWYKPIVMTTMADFCGDSTRTALVGRCAFITSTTDTIACAERWNNHHCRYQNIIFLVTWTQQQQADMGLWNDNEHKHWLRRYRVILNSGVITEQDGTPLPAVAVTLSFIKFIDGHHEVINLVRRNFSNDVPYLLISVLHLPTEENLRDVLMEVSKESFSMSFRRGPLVYLPQWLWHPRTRLKSYSRTIPLDYHWT